MGTAVGQPGKGLDFILKAELWGGEARASHLPFGIDTLVNPFAKNKVLPPSPLLSVSPDLMGTTLLSRSQGAGRWENITSNIVQES